MAAKKKAPRYTKKAKTAAKDDKRKYAARIVVDLDKVYAICNAPGGEDTNLGRLAAELSRLYNDGRDNYGFAVNACKNIFGLGLNVLSDLKKVGVWRFAGDPA
jgi:hypothetical protein